MNHICLDDFAMAGFLPRSQLAQFAAGGVQTHPSCGRTGIGASEGRLERNHDSKEGVAKFTRALRAWFSASRKRPLAWCITSFAAWQHAFACLTVSLPLEKIAHILTSRFLVFAVEEIDHIVQALQECLDVIEEPM